jgi:SNF2 family DNA or RNA helicase
MKFRDFIINNNLKFQQYQEEGYEWCVEREENKLDFQSKKAGIIADEMGTGKTILIISLLVCNPYLKNLIIVPLPLLNQWVEAIKRYTQYEPFVYYGNSRKHCEKLHSHSIVITTYGLIVREYKKINKLYNFVWDRIIFDEAHHMRNKKTGKFQAGFHLNGNIKWLLTGTPIQNRLSDLYSLCEICGIDNPKNIDVERLKELYIKRTKKEVNINMPSLSYQTINVDWQSKKEQQISQALHSVILPLTFIKIKREDILLFNYYKDQVKKIFGDRLLPYYLRSKQMCVCPNLMIEKIQSRELEIDRDVYSNILDGCQYTTKLDEVVNFVEKRDNENKKLIFCQFHREMEILKNKFLEKQIESVEIYSGNLNKTKRNKLLENLPNILIIQMQMGCEGLNLQEMNEVYFVSPFWNPAMEEQAIGRCYRLGQMKPTYVFKFKMNSVYYLEENITMDDYIDNVQNNKKELKNTFIS